ncbi:MAG: dienelactone hydrolase family protein [Gemmataceae bacterium]
MATSHEDRNVDIHLGEHTLRGILNVPAEARAIVVFVHGSGSSRLSPRNQMVARALQQAGLATLLFDLLDEREEEDRNKVFNIELLADRLQAAADWLMTEESSRNLPLGYFGASTGAAAALLATARQPWRVRAIVSRGGRPDLVMDDLPRVPSPTLLIVGGNDQSVLYLHEEVMLGLRCPSELAVIPGAGHLFEEPGALEKVAELARDWFLRCFAAPQR